MPVPLSIFRSSSKFDENSECSRFEYTRPITTIFCTRHDSDTVVTCAKYRCGRPHMLYTRVFWIGPSRMFSVLTEGCHVGYSREFVDTVYCSYGQSNKTYSSGLILGLRQANGRRRYFVTRSLIALRESIPRLLNEETTVMTACCARLAARPSQSNPRGSGPEVLKREWGHVTSETGVAGVAVFGALQRNAGCKPTVSPVQWNLSITTT